MATYIRTLKDKAGNLFLPRTRAEAITGDGGDFMDLEWCINLNF